MNMKNTYKHIAAAFAFIAAVSCAKQEINNPQDGNVNGTYQYLLNVSQEDDTKTIMDGTTILWSADDKIAVMGINGGDLKSASHSGEQSIADAENYVSSTQATFALNLPEGFTPMVATYPFHAQNSLEYINLDKNAENSTEDSLTCRFYIHSQQTAVKDGFPLEGFPMVGRIVDGKCSMHNAGALIKFEIVNPDIVSIRFEGNNKEYISGRSYYYVDSGIFARSTGSSEQSVTLVPSGAVFEPGVYYFAVAPQNLTKGFKITVTNRFGQEAMKKSNASFNIERNHKYTNFGSDEGWFKDIYTGNAGNLGSADGTTATLYGIIYNNEIQEGDKFGFQTSADGVKWSKFEGEITNRFTSVFDNTPLNVYTATLTGLTPGVETYYRTYCNKSNGVVVYGKAKPIQTYAGATSVAIDLYNGHSEGYWPFTNLTAGTDIVAGTSSSAKHLDEEVNLTLASGHSFAAKATQGMWLNRYNGCLTMKVNKNDYIKFPVIPGKKPVCVILTLGSVQSSEIANLTNSNNSQGLPAIAKVTNDGAGITGGGSKWDPRPAYKYDSHVWHLENTDDGQYEIYFGADAVNSYITYLEVIYTDFTGIEKQEKIENNILFSTRVGSDGGSTQWPFVQEFLNYKKQTCPTSELYTATYPDLKYQFYIKQLPTTGTNKWEEDFFRQTGGAGLSWGSEPGDYMAILPVADYRVTNIKIRHANKATTYSVTDSKGNVLVGPTKAKGSHDEELIFPLEGTTANTEYRLVLGGDLNNNGVVVPSGIREMWITYELEK